MYCERGKCRYRNASNKCSGAYSISKVWGGRLFEGGRFFEGGAYIIASITHDFTSVTCRNFVTIYKRFLRTNNKAITTKLSIAYLYMHNNLLI